MGDCKHGPDCCCAAELSRLRAENERLREALERRDGLAANPEMWSAPLRVEVERLRAIIRATHATHCTEAWTGRGLHAPECLLHEVDERHEKA